MVKISYKGAISAASGTTAILYIICASAYAIAPSAAIKFFNSFFHGIDLTAITKQSMSFGSTLTGFVLMVI